MNPRHTVLLLLGVLLALAAVYLQKQNLPIYSEPSTLPKALLNMDKFKMSLVQRIRIAKGSYEVLLQKNQDRWALLGAWGYEARQDDVSMLLAALAKIRSPELRYQEIITDEVRQRFGLETKNSWIVELAGKKGPLLQLRIGNHDSDKNICILQIAEDSKIYSVNPDLIQQGALYGGKHRVQAWIDLEFFSLSDRQKDRLQKIQITTAQEEFVVERTAEGWGWQQSSALSAKAMELWLKGFELVYALFAVDPELLDQYGLVRPSKRITLSFDQGPEVSFLIGNKAPARAGQSDVDFYVKLAADSRVFRVKEFVLQRILRTTTVLSEQ